ncbi:MAG TPA: ABC transporter permease [Gemmatimonadaceae bacterium]|nr:ABC transporter permease [Gemmatimonadaceae bacterium]
MFFHRDVRAGALLETVAQDIRYAARTLIKQPSFTIVAITALGLGIGATTAIFSVVNGVLLRPLPYAEPDRLVTLLHYGQDPVAPANYLDWKRHSTTFSSMGAAEYWSGNVIGDITERVQGLRVTAEILHMTGVRPILGRIFVPDDEVASAERPAVLAWGYWQRRFAGSRDVLGQQLVIDGVSYRVIGVMPRGFDFPMFWATGVQVWSPLTFGERATSRRGASLRVFARLAPNATIDAARSQVASITGTLEREFPGTNREVVVTPLETMVVGDVRTVLLVLLGAVGFVLLIACANVAHMLLARASARQREMHVRLALGASRRRLVRQMLTESAVLGAAGGLVGVLLARYGLRVLIALSAGSLPRADSVVLDGGVLAVTALISLATGLAFGLLPAIRVSRAEVADALRDGARGSTEGMQRGRLRAMLMGSEIALALVLLAAAGLAIRSFIALRGIDPGFDPRGVVSAVITLRGTVEAAPTRRTAFYTAALERVRQLPGVESASFINHLPIGGDNWGFGFGIEGRPAPRPGEEPRAVYRVVFPGYFDVMRLPVLRGRAIDDRDRLGTTPVVVVNDWFAQRHWPNENAVGKRITLDPGSTDPAWVTVVGVVKNAVRADWAAPPEEEMYLPYLQTRQYLEGEGGHVAYMTLVVRAACGAEWRCDPAALAPAVRAAVGSINRGVPVTDVQTMASVADGATARPRLTLALLATFAAVALVLAAAGIYGVVSYAVSRRTHEIGVRMALGATPSAVIGLIVGQGMRVVALGATAGLAGALLVTRLMTAFLYGVGATDPATYASVTLVLMTVAVVACVIPARRATRIDPLTAMRSD